MRIAITLKKSGPGFAAVMKQQPFALANAINRTLEEAQAAQRGVVHTGFTVRNPGFIDRLIKIKTTDRARKDRLIGRLRIEGPQGDPDRGVVLSRHEEESTHTRPGGPLNAFFIPADVLRPSRTSVVPRNLYPKNLRLMDRMAPSGMLYAKRHTTKRGIVQIKGKQRTFVLVERGTGSGGDGRAFGIYQREGPHDIQLLWLYARKLHLRPRLRFGETFVRTVNERLLINYRGMLASALRTAR